MANIGIFVYTIRQALAAPITGNNTQAYGLKNHDDFGIFFNEFSAARMDLYQTPSIRGGRIERTKTQVVTRGEPCHHAALRALCNIIKKRGV